MYDIEFNSMNTANLAFIEEVNVFEHLGGARIIENNLYGQDRSGLWLHQNWTLQITVIPRVYFTPLECYWWECTQPWKNKDFIKTMLIPIFSSTEWFYSYRMEPTQILPNKGVLYTLGLSRDAIQGCFTPSL